MNISPVSATNLKPKYKAMNNAISSFCSPSINKKTPINSISFGSLGDILSCLFVKKLTPEQQREKERYLYTKLYNESRDIKAHELAKDNPEELSKRLEGLEDKTKCQILSTVNRYDITPAIILAERHPESYYKITKGFLDLRQSSMLVRGKDDTEIVARYLAKSSPAIFNKIIKKFPEEWQKDILNRKDSQGVTVKEVLEKSKKQKVTPPSKRFKL